MSLGFGGKSSELGTYFTEVSDHFATLTDPEEKALLAANAVEEVRIWRTYHYCLLPSRTCRSAQRMCRLPAVAIDGVPPLTLGPPSGF